MEIRDALVPIDFSPNSLRAIEFAASLVGEDGEVCLLHVIDAEFVSRLCAEGFSEVDEAVSRLREKAEANLKQIIEAIPEPRPQLESMIVVGKPFAEILRVAVDLDFPMIILCSRGIHTGDIEEVLFGSTAEKVLRAARVPVVCIPGDWSKSA